MSQFTESGHSKNAANFDHMISVLTTFGSAYAPPRTDMTLANLGTTNTAAQTILTSVKDKYTTWKSATNAREIAFKAVRPLATRLYNTLLSCGVTQQTLDDFKSLNRKLQGGGKKKIKKVAPESPSSDIPSDDLAKSTAPSEEEKVPVSTSQRSFDNQIEHFDKIVKLLATTSVYTPTESDLKVTALNTLLASLRTLNSNAVNSYSNVTASRIARNHFFYDEPSGLVSLARSVKGYVKGHFGASSLEYKQVSRIKFFRIKTGR